MTFLTRDLVLATDIESIVASAVTGLGYELVDLERTARGLVRVFIDKPAGISVEDCASVSNHLTRVFAVEDFEFERLEVSSPGLDRPLKTLDAFSRFRGCAVKVKLNAMVDGRRKFEGEIDRVESDGIVFRLIEAATASKAAAGAKVPAKASASVVKSKAANIKSKAAHAAQETKLICVPLGNIDRARLIPDI